MYLAAQRAPVVPTARDSRGRFIKKSTPGPGDDASGRTAPLQPARFEASGESRAFSAAAERIVGVLRESGAGMEEADPTVKAFQEIAQPIGRGYALLTGGSGAKKEEGWLRRIYQSLSGLRKEEALFSKVAAKRLKAIEEKPVATTGGAGGLLGGLPAILAGLLRKIPGAGLLASGAGALATGAKRAAVGAGRGAMRMGRGLLGRIPLIGALLGGVGAAADIYDSENDETISRRDKDERAGSAVGGLAGSVGGMFAGAKLGALVGAVGGPIGMAIGGAIGGAVGMFFGDKAGQILGTTVGGWVSDLRDADIAGTIATAWDNTIQALEKSWDLVTAGLAAVGEGLGEAWDKFVASAKAGWDVITGGISSAYEALKNLPVIGPAITAIEGAASKVASVASATAAGAKELASKSVSKVADAAVHVGDQAKKGVAAGATYLAENTTVGRGAVKAWEATAPIRGKVAERWREAKSYLLGASEKAGVNAGTVAKIANFESGFDSTAAPIRKDGTRISSAHGYGQFIDGTWTDMVNKHGAKYGVEGAGRLSKDQAAKYRGDKTIQAAMLAEFTRENVEKGRKYGGADDDANVYAFHNLGDKDAKNLLTGMQRNPLMTVRESLLQGATTDKERNRVEAVISGNKSLYGNGDVTAVEAYARMGKVMRRGEAFAADALKSQGAAATALPNPVVAAGAPAGTEEPPAGVTGEPFAGQVGAALGAASAPVAARPATGFAASASRGSDSSPAGIGLPMLDTGKIGAALATTFSSSFSVAAPAAPVIAAVKMPAVPSAPTMPALAEAPQVAVPMTAPEPRRSIRIVPAPTDVGQDLRERGIAHIATGGLGSS
jgi:hypothetical protein